MKIKYTFADGTSSEVEVSEEVGSVIVDSRQQEANLDRKERSHCYSLDAITYEGVEYAAKATPESDLEQRESRALLLTALNRLTKTQRRRLLMHMDGLTLRQIAEIEHTSYQTIDESLKAARRKIGFFTEF